MQFIEGTSFHASLGRTGMKKRASSEIFVRQIRTTVRKWELWVINTLAPKLTPREKIEFEVTIFQLKRCFMSLQNKMASVFSIILRGLTLIFSRTLENLIVGSLGEVNPREMFQTVFKMLPCYE